MKSFVRAFSDANGDGIGDLAGLTSKLDYLQELGIDCIWLLPIYPSPLRDDGYDVADFYRIHPDYGTVEDLGQSSGRSAPAWAAGHRRHDPQPHLGPTSLVSGVARSCPS